MSLRNKCRTAMWVMTLVGTFSVAALTYQMMRRCEQSLAQLEKVP